MRTFVFASTVITVSLCASCHRHPPPAPPTTTVQGQSLRVEGVPGVPTVDIHGLGDGGGTHIQIGAARVDLPGTLPVPIPGEDDN